MYETQHLFDAGNNITSSLNLNLSVRVGVRRGFTIHGSHYAAMDDAVCISFRKLVSYIYNTIVVWLLSCMIYALIPSLVVLSMCCIALGCIYCIYGVYKCLRPVLCDGRMATTESRIIYRSLGAGGMESLVDPKSFPLLRALLGLGLLGLLTASLVLLTILLLYIKVYHYDIAMWRALYPLCTLYLVYLVLIALSQSVSAVTGVMYLLLGVQLVSTVQWVVCV